MFLVKITHDQGYGRTRDELRGVFKTADAAAEWARMANLAMGCWVILPIEAACSYR